MNKMSNPIFPYGTDGIPRKTLKVATAAIPFGTPVEISAAQTIQSCDNYEDCIGHVLPDESYEAQNGSTSVAVGDLAQVALRGPVIKLTAGTTISAGDKLTLMSNYRANNDFESGTTGKFAGIALEAGGSGSTFEAVRL